VGELIAFGSKHMKRLRAYFSLSGSFSRTELLLAILMLMALAVIFASIRRNYPEGVADGAYKAMVFALYPIWGVALGKRSRDIGTTFTYGMIIGMLFPVIGIVFLFQAGKKFQMKAKRTESSGQA